MIKNFVKSQQSLVTYVFTSFYGGLKAILGLSEKPSKSNDCCYDFSELLYVSVF